MQHNMPRTPFSTALSRSAREIELRLRNIMSGPKKRPPLPFLILMFSVCIFCGNIVSCQFREDTPPDTSQSVVSQPDVSQQIPDSSGETKQNTPEQPDITNPPDASSGSNLAGTSTPDQEPDVPAPYTLEVCLYRDGYSIPIGPGNWVDSMFQDFEPEVTVQEGLDVYRPDDYWEEWVVGNDGDAGGISARRYYDSEADSWFLNRLETGRTDMYTPRGIRVGAARDEVLAAYPGLLSDEKNWQWAYPDDYLWYCDNEDGLGPCLYFFFTDDVVSMIQMVDMFN